MGGYNAASRGKQRAKFRGRPKSDVHTIVVFDNEHETPYMEFEVKERDVSLLDPFVPEAAEWLVRSTNGRVTKTLASAALLFVDMNDFVKTSMGTARDLSSIGCRMHSRRAASRGSRHVFETSSQCNSYMREVLAEYFERLIRIVNAYDGSVVALIGDAMLAAWFVEANQNGADGRLTHVTQRARFCAQSILSDVHGCALRDALIVKVKLMISTGPVTFVPIRLVSRSYEVTITGEALNDFRKMKHDMEAGKIVFNKLSSELLSRAITPCPTSLSCGSNSTRDHASSRIGTDVTHFVSAHVVQALNHGLIYGLPSKNEVCTVVFVRFSAEAIEREDWCDERFIHCVKTIEFAVLTFQGSLLQIVVDENGPSCMCAFGLLSAPKRHAASRGLRCAQRILRALPDFKTRVACGVATGSVNMGSVCGTKPSEFHVNVSLIGLPVILAARLAEATNSRSVAMDEETRVHATSFNFDMTRSSWYAYVLKGFPRGTRSFVVDYS